MHTLVLAVVLSLPPQPPQGLLIKRLAPPVAPEIVAARNVGVTLLEVIASYGVTVVGLLPLPLIAPMGSEIFPLAVYGIGGAIQGITLPFATSAVVWAIEHAVHPKSEYLPILLTSFVIRASLYALGFVVFLARSPQTQLFNYLFSQEALTTLAVGFAVGPIVEVTTARLLSAHEGTPSVPLASFAF